MRICTKEEIASWYSQVQSTVEKRMLTIEDPSQYLPDGWFGTALDILNVDNMPELGRLWIVLRQKFLQDRFLRAFSLWCVDHIDKSLIVDESGLNALIASMKFLHGDISAMDMSYASRQALAAAILEEGKGNHLSALALMATSVVCLQSPSQAAYYAASYTHHLGSHCDEFNPIEFLKNALEGGSKPENANS